ncbi:MAG TPA: DUF4861 family protein [Anaerolineae bacterium]|nr:DUF4861 family protein [Anaerolineae bacterium]
MRKSKLLDNVIYIREQATTHMEQTMMTTNKKTEKKYISTQIFSRILMSGIIVCGLTHISFAQGRDEPAVNFEKKLELVIFNPLESERTNEPIAIPVTVISEKAPDFNRYFFRLKHKTNWYEPLDIPSQIMITTTVNGNVEELMFNVNLAPLEKKVVELWYNPQGTGLPDYPVKTQSFEKWYTGGTNVAWENELIAYRSYNGLVDYFAKTYLHLRLHDLVPDSYHHERLWGIDPFVIGSKPGLCGVILFKGENQIKCYGSSENLPLSYIHKAYEGGPVCTGIMVSVNMNDERVLEETYTLFNGRYENIVTTVISKNYRGDNVLVAPGMQKFDSADVLVNEQKGFMAFQGSPVEEYGTIGMALIWNPENARGVFETEDGHFIKLKPTSNGTVKYLSLAVWYRGSTLQPVSDEPFISMVEKIALGFANPVRIEIIEH